MSTDQRRATSPSGLFRGDKPVTDWPSIRAWVLDRDEHHCKMCHVRDATDVDHIWPRRLGGEDHVNNLRAACGPCNKAKGDRVDVSLASLKQLYLAVDALDARVAALVEEREVYENALINLLFSADSDATFAAGARALRMAQLGAMYSNRAARWRYVSDRESKRLHDESRPDKAIYHHLQLKSPESGDLRGDLGRGELARRIVSLLDEDQRRTLVRTVVTQWLTEATGHAHKLGLGSIDLEERTFTVDEERLAEVEKVISGALLDGLTTDE